MDFTKKWLADDIKSWTSVKPKPDLLAPCRDSRKSQPQLQRSSMSATATNYDEFDDEYDDDRSIGSCSAEVAAITDREQLRKRRPMPMCRETPDLIVNIESNNNQKNAVAIKKNAGGGVIVRPAPIRHSKSPPQRYFISAYSHALTVFFRIQQQNVNDAYRQLIKPSSAVYAPQKTTAIQNRQQQQVQII